MTISNDQVFALQRAMLYGATIFLSAFLLFQVQPIIGKLILPWFGGSASVWTICLLFFQSLLLLGYLYSHWVVRFLSPRHQSWLHIAVLAASCLVLPIIPGAEWKPLGDEDPTLLILGLLTVTIGLPYFALSTTGPLLQAWFARERPGSVPYRLFALSNFGSMIALLSYPFGIEPFLTTRWQSWIWSGGFVVFALLCSVLALRGARHSAAVGNVAGVNPAHPVAPLASAPTLGLMALWAALAACPSLLLVAVTSHLTQHVAPIPLLWILPLALYLLSFILCFEHPRWYQRWLFVPLLVASLVAHGWLSTLGISDINIRWQVLIHLLALFTFCMVCHGELSRLRPDPRHLTGFYLMLALGGALGGGFVALVAPNFFIAEFELPIGLVLTAAVTFYVLLRDRKPYRIPRRALVASAVGGTALLGFVLASEQYSELEGSRAVARNFYGTLHVTQKGNEGDIDARRWLYHGSIVHGDQYLHADRRQRPTTYYGPTTGAGLAIELTRTPAPQRVGILGLGAGTLLTYGRPEDYYRGYEINPLVLELARTEFSYLADARARVDVVLGDGRLALERDAPQGFDVLLVDAFSGDAVPAHLLTREAFALYFRHLKPDGVLAFHITNRFLDLTPIVALAARQLGYGAVLISNERDDAADVYRASWMLVTNNAALLENPKIRAAMDTLVIPSSKVRPWTDDYSSLLPILK
ncbi:MAG: fused MFS/spermidine synthase [Rhodocyclaceae bacterium]|nr:fused MFS/spermidine synthase [Rhodocyclaceae bacterium]MDP1956861.1 fused MFS/spermidine synthase [Rhodocyclaceae bacterium]